MKSRFEYDKKLIGARLRYYRKMNNFTAEYVRDYLSIASVQAIYKWENGSTMPAVDNFLALMDLYGITSFEKLMKKIPVFDEERILTIELPKTKQTYTVYEMV